MVKKKFQQRLPTITGFALATVVACMTGSTGHWLYKLIAILFAIIMLINIAEVMLHARKSR